MTEQVNLEPTTFLDKVEVAFAEAKAWVIKEVGDHMSVHNVFSALKADVLTHVAAHFGEDSDSADLQHRYDTLLDAHNDLVAEHTDLKSQLDEGKEDANVTPASDSTNSSSQMSGSGKEEVK